MVTLFVSCAIRFAVGAARRVERRGGHAPAAGRPSAAAQPESAAEKQRDEPLTDVAWSEPNAVDAASKPVEGAVADTEMTDEATSTPPSVGAGENFDELTKAELYRRAQDARISGRSTMNKAELIEALRASQSAG